MSLQSLEPAIAIHISGARRPRAGRFARPVIGRFAVCLGRARTLTWQALVPLKKWVRTSAAQSLSHTGSFGWSVASGELYWSAETYNIFGHDRAVKPKLEMALRRIHPDDRDLVQQTHDRVIETKADFDLAHRLLMPDGSVKKLDKDVARSATSTNGCF